MNRLLGERPSLGPIPGDQIVPWGIIFAIALALKLFAGLSWFWACVLFFWGASTWWILTGRRAWRFLDRFTRRPRWRRTFKRYESPLQWNDKDDE